MKRAEVKKIRSDVEATPEMLIGMLAGYSGEIKNIAAIVQYNDGSWQLIHNAMQLRDLAFAYARFQKEVLEDL